MPITSTPMPCVPWVWHALAARRARRPWRRRVHAAPPARRTGPARAGGAPPPAPAPLGHARAPPAGPHPAAPQTPARRGGGRVLNTSRTSMGGTRPTMGVTLRRGWGLLTTASSCPTWSCHSPATSARTSSPISLSTAWRCAGAVDQRPSARTMR
eukprot:8094576-Pyramimonas_sp.AAC.1